MGNGEEIGENRSNSWEIKRIGCLAKWKWGQGIEWCVLHPFLFFRLVIGSYQHFQISKDILPTMHNGKHTSVVLVGVQKHCVTESSFYYTFFCTPTGAMKVYFRYTSGCENISQWYDFAMLVGVWKNV